MVAELESQLATQESRLREIDRELAALRREQRLFRRIGFAENFKVMQIVALQAERQECLAALPPGGRGRRRHPAAPRAEAIARQGAGLAALVLGLLLFAARALLTFDGRAWLPRRQARNAAGYASPLRANAAAPRRVHAAGPEAVPVPLYLR